MNRLIGLVLLAGATMPIQAQRLLTLDSCRAMALRNNKQMSVTKVKQDVAANIRKSMRTKYLPHVSALGTYQYTSRPISLLNDHQKAALPQIGTATAMDLKGGIDNAVAQLPCCWVRWVSTWGL